jgi:hypothetical protein
MYITDLWKSGMQDKFIVVYISCNNCGTDVSQEKKIDVSMLHFPISHKAHSSYHQYFHLLGCVYIFIIISHYSMANWALTSLLKTHCSLSTGVGGDADFIDSVSTCSDDHKLSLIPPLSSHP